MNDYYQDLRKEYAGAELKKKLVSKSPFVQFEKWFNDAISANVDIVNAMSLATSSDEISIRTVLLKSFNENGFVFFTNYNSEKSKQIQQNPNVALLFPWLQLDRQVKIIGIAEKISFKDSLRYWITRPIDSQIAAAASKQSMVVQSKQMLINEFKKIKNSVQDNKLLMPNSWGGYVVKPHLIEFWQGQKSRLHDRICYKLEKDIWKINRLNP